MVLLTSNRVITLSDTTLSSVFCTIRIGTEPVLRVYFKNPPLTYVFMIQKVYEIKYGFDSDLIVRNSDDAPWLLINVMTGDELRLIFSLVALRTSVDRLY